MDPQLSSLLVYVFIFLAAVVFSYVINGLLLKFSRTLGSRGDHARHLIRWASPLKPSLGGFSFYILFLISLPAFGFVSGISDDLFSPSLLGVMLAVNLGFLLGLTDDALNTIPILKFSAQLLCGLLLIATGTIIPASGIFAFDAAITLLWVVGLMNSINMLDNMDGISASVSLGVLMAMLLVLGMEGSFFSVNTLMILAVGGSLIGFLFHNSHPARIYMGDTGSQFLGVFIAAVSIQVLWKYHQPAGSMIQPKQLLIPLMALSVPIIDTTTVVIHRIARGQSPFVGGRDHITHHFAYAGLSERQVMYLLAGWTALSGVLAALMIYFYDQLTLTAVIAGYSFLIISFLVTQYFYDLGKRRESEHEKSKEIQPAAFPAQQSITA
jgi:UDP-GlcNAc:undecaprenyl-phosphate GlcNAc-1-phosphate transferase